MQHQNPSTKHSTTAALYVSRQQAHRAFFICPAITAAYGACVFVYMLCRVICMAAARDRVRCGQKIRVHVLCEQHGDKAYNE